MSSDYVKLPVILSYAHIVACIIRVGIVIEYVQCLWKYALLGQTLFQLNHTRVIQLIGIAYDNTPIIITDYMMNGDLSTYLKNHPNVW